MPIARSSSERSSAATSSRPPATPLNESAYLTQQATDAKAAISRVVSDFKQELAHGVDPRAWMQVHPWATMGAAAVAGFVAAVIVVPSEEQRALKRLAAIERALNPAHRRDVGASLNGEQVNKVEEGRGSFLSGLAGQVLRAVQPILMSAITAGVTAKVAQPQQPDASGGGAGGSGAGGEPPPNGDTGEPSI